MLIYRLAALNYLLSSIRQLIFTVFWGCLYLYFFGFILLALSAGLHSVSSLHPIAVVKYAFSSLIWLYKNRSVIGYGIVIRTLIAMITPALIYQGIKKTSWRYLLYKVFYLIKSKKSSRECVNTKTPNEEVHTAHVANESDLDLIKSIVMRDIEKIVDHRLTEITKILKEKRQATQPRENND